MEYINALRNKIEEAFDIPVRIVDFNDVNLSLYLKESFCKACHEKQIRENGFAQCNNLMEQAVKQSYKWGGRYEFICPAGVAFIAVSIFEGSIIKKGIVFGPFIMISHEDFLSDDFNGLFRYSRRDMIKQLKELKFVSPNKVTSISDLLLMMISYTVIRENETLSFLNQTADFSKGIIDRVYKKEDNITEEEYPFKQEKLLQKYVTQGDKSKAQAILNDILGYIYFTAIKDYSMLKARVIELIVLLSRSAIEGGADINRVLGLNKEFLKDILEIDNIEDLSSWLSMHLTRYTKLVFTVADTKHNDTIQKIMKYVNANYMNKITLNDISEHVSFSVSYISRIFKDEKKMNLATYINNVRIRNACCLLVESGYSIAEISYLCGFEEQSYFTRMFKSVTDRTPREYREQRGVVNSRERKNPET
ncbi:MAG: helix-turn-helix domain-containing protein [Clostridia bacterium]|jgi:AraC-like DNA-binding protein|nr:helix-turn-helix domain-containing protein [Clostridia bacterium]HQM95516.1 helix-turn-helix domain-containing protein [Clostridia bacterium]HQO69751.1 helix-turn-helix domain-containing protein [Clostridia bacterium]